MTNRNRTIARRDVLKGGALLAGGAHAWPTQAASAVPPASTVRDRLWLWAHEAGSHNKAWSLPAPSRITPVEAAFYMNVPNLIMVRYEGSPEPPFQQYAVPFRPLREVVWSVVGSGGDTEHEERESVLKLAFENANFSGVMMDDFFNLRRPEKISSLTIEQLEQLQKRLKGGARKLDLWVVLYDHQLDAPVGEHLKQCDVVSYWTWQAKNLKDLEANFARAEKLSPTARKVLGCYMYDYGDKKPMPIASMERQCQLGLEWLRQGRIDGMIFLATCICDLGLETVEWTRAWIQKVGEQELPRT